jgi:hypothetical protein
MESQFGDYLSGKLKELDLNPSAYAKLCSLDSEATIATKALRRLFGLSFTNNALTSYRRAHGGVATGLVAERGYYFVEGLIRHIIESNTLEKAQKLGVLEDYFLTGNVPGEVVGSGRRQKTVGVQKDGIPSDISKYFEQFPEMKEEFVPVFDAILNVVGASPKEYEAAIERAMGTVSEGNEKKMIVLRIASEDAFNVVNEIFGPAMKRIEGIRKELKEKYTKGD